MKVDGPKQDPIKPVDAASRLGKSVAGSGKSGTKPAGKSFSDILGKAKAGHKPNAVPQSPAGATPSPASSQYSQPAPHAPTAASPLPGLPPVPAGTGFDRTQPGGSADADASQASHMDLIRLRMKTGYYNNPQVDDALGDKLSGYFDDIAE